MSALPLRSTHSSTMLRLSASSSITTDLTAAIPASAHTRQCLRAPDRRPRLRSVPGERSLFPDVSETGGEHRDEYHHLDQTWHAEPPKHDRPWIHEDDLDVENDEQDGDQVEPHREPSACRTGRRIAALEHLLLDRVRMRAPEQAAEQRARAAHD